MAELYRRKQASFIEANQLTKDNVIAVALWCGAQQVEEVDPEDPSITFVALNVPTLSGVKRVSEGDYVVKAEDYTFTTVKSQQFDVAYEKVD